MNERNKFQIINDEGKQVECETLFTFESDESRKNYIVYTDNTIDTDGSVKVYAATYKPEEMKKEVVSFEPIETEEEWNSIEEILNNIQNEIKGVSEQ